MTENERIQKDTVLKEQIEKLIKDSGYTYVNSGMLANEGSTLYTFYCTDLEKTNEQ